MAILLAHKAMGNSFWLNGRKENMAWVGDDDGAGASAVGGIHQLSRITGIANQTFNWCGFRADDGHYSISGHDIAKADVDKFNIHGFRSKFLKT